MNTIEKITWAREILDIPEQATLLTIKQNYKELQRKWHPDLCREKVSICHEMTIQLNEAYDIITTYIEQYSFSFAEDEVKKYYTGHEWWKSRFG